MKKQPIDEFLFVDVFSDFGFKLLFGNKNNTLFLKRALETLIPSLSNIQKITFGSIELLELTKESRKGLVDFSCEDDKGRHYIIEMQRYDLSFFFNKLKFYASLKYNELVKKGDFSFKNIGQIFAIVFVPEKMFPQYEELVHLGKIYNQHHQLLNEQITYIVVELGKFNKSIDQLNSELDKFLFFMKTVSNLKSKDNLPEYFQKEDWYAEAIKLLESSNLTPRQRTAYEIEIANRRAEEDAKEELEQRLRNEIRERLEKEIRERLENEMKERLEKEVKEKVEKEVNEVKEKVEKEVKEKVEKELEERLEKMEKSTIEFMVIQLLNDGKYSITEVAKMANISQAEVLDIQQKIKK